MLYGRYGEPKRTGDRDYYSDDAGLFIIIMNWKRALEIEGKAEVRDVYGNRISGISAVNLVAL